MNKNFRASICIPTYQMGDVIDNCLRSLLMGTSDDIEIVAPFGIDVLFEYTITPNRKRPKPEVFAQRLQEKRWLEIWPNLVVNA